MGCSAFMPIHSSLIPPKSQRPSERPSERPTDFSCINHIQHFGDRKRLRDWRLTTTYFLEPLTPGYGATGIQLESVAERTSREEEDGGRVRRRTRRQRKEKSQKVRAQSTSQSSIKRCACRWLYACMLGCMSAGCGSNSEEMEGNERCWISIIESDSDQTLLEEPGDRMKMTFLFTNLF